MDICSEGSKLLEGPTGEKGLGVRRGQHRAGKGQDQAMECSAL